MYFVILNVVVVILNTALYSVFCHLERSCCHLERSYVQRSSCHLERRERSLNNMPVQKQISPFVSNDTVFGVLQFHQIDAVNFKP